MDICNDESNATQVEGLWNIYISIKFKTCYFRRYNARSQTINRVLLVICAFTSAASVASWGLWEYLPWLWAALVMLAQLITVFSPHFYFSKRCASFNFLLPRLEDLLLEIDNDWRKISGYSTQKIISLISKYQKEYQGLENQFIGNIPMPDIQQLIDAALDDMDKYFHHYYNVRSD